LLKEAFASTYGFPLYDESLLILARDVAGWDLGEADKLRKLTKEKGKNPEKALKWKKEFIEGAEKNKVRKEISEKIWVDIVEPYGRYAFNKSHAVVYSMISYKTAYLKAHYPIEFLLANLMMQVNSNAPDAKDNIQKIKKEMRDNKIKILPPDINKSEMVYTLIDDKTLLTGLDALKSVGDDGINDILLKRPFNSFFDFMSKVDSKKVRANTIQALAGSGAIDSFGLSRRAMYQYCQDYRKKLQIWLKTHDPKTETFNYPWAKENEWKISELYALELEYLNEAFICKPHLAYNEFFKENHGSISDIKKKTEKTIIPSMKVIVIDFREFKVKKEASKFYGMSMIKATVEDKFGESCSLTIFPDKWTKVEQRLKQISSKFKFDVGMALHISASTNAYEDEVGLILESLFNAAMIPAKPDDIKEKKKVSLKDAKKTQNATLDLFSKIEDSLYDQGLIDFEDE
jgi:DNA polymerase-3 subunit alpha